ncbi:MAG TPA: N-acetylmuramoyl-L-alanine amidase, partial [Solirubrobacteraceae bacterium]|nr:N-acetylmuramoyl-L-alanine amidase [Solirubrobacteraceae bacterium]
RRSRDGDHATLAARGRIVALRRDSTRALVAGRALELSAPVRVRRGAWLAPGDLLVRALPVLLGTGVQVAVGAAPAAPRPAVTPVSLPPRAPERAPRATAPPAPVRAESPVPPPPAAPTAPAPAPVVEADPGAAPANGAVKAGGVELRYRSYPAYTRVVLEGTAPFEPRLVDGPGGLVVPLAGLRGGVPRVTRAVRDGLVATLQLGAARGAATLRVTFERPPASRKVYRLQDPPRLVLDFFRGPAAAPVPPAAAPAPAPAAELRTIVIDAGHGGQDPGAVGAGGLQEKALTLDVARRLAALVQDDLGIRTVLTRTRDVFLPLRERTALANRVKADLFVSIHVNAAPRATATGTESYFLSSEATDNAARAAAAFENKVIDLEPGPRGGSRSLVRSILWDLAQSEFQQESSRLAESLQDSLDRALRLPSRGVKQAPFYVLGGAAMPAVLVEMGFITNPREEERLNDEGYRDRIARALAAGLAAYKRRYDQKNGVLATR